MSKVGGPRVAHALNKNTVEPHAPTSHRTTIYTAGWNADNGMSYDAWLNTCDSGDEFGLKVLTYLYLQPHHTPKCTGLHILQMRGFAG